MGVRASNHMRSRVLPVASKLMASTLMSAKYFSPSLGGRTWPEIVSPVRSPNFLICDGLT